MLKSQMSHVFSEETDFFLVPFFPLVTCNITLSLSNSNENKLVASDDVTMLNYTFQDGSLTNCM